MYFSFWNVTSIHGFTSVLTVVCVKTRMIWLSLNASKQSHVCINIFILTTSNNEQHLWKCVIVDEYGTFAKSKYVVNLLVYDFNISIETTGGYPTKYHPSYYCTTMCRIKLPSFQNYQNFYLHQTCKL